MKLELKEILEDGNNYEEMYYDIIDFIQDIELHENFEKLNPGERSIYLIEKLVFEVNNGGFDQYLEDTDGEYTKETIDYLKASGNEMLADLLKRAEEAYESGESEDAIADKMNVLNDEFYDKIDYDDYYRTIIQYVKANEKLFD